MTRRWPLVLRRTAEAERAKLTEAHKDQIRALHVIERTFLATENERLRRAVLRAEGVIRGAAPKVWVADPEVPLGEPSQLLFSDWLKREAAHRDPQAAEWLGPVKS